MISLRIKKTSYLTFAGILFFLLGLPASCADSFTDGLAHTNKTELVDLANKARSAYAAANFDNAESLWTEALGQAERADSLSVVDCLCNLAKVKDKQNDPVESDRLYEFAMRTLEQYTKSQDNYLYADYLLDLGDLYNRHGKPEKAELIYKKLLDIRINKNPINGSSTNKENEIVKAEEAYAHYLREHNQIPEAIQHENNASGLRYRLQLAPE